MIALTSILGTRDTKESSLFDTTALRTAEGVAFNVTVCVVVLIDSMIDSTGWPMVKGVCEGGKLANGKKPLRP